MNKKLSSLFEILHKFRLNNGFYIASTSYDYSYTWLRDNFYCSLPELWNNQEFYIQTYQTWLDYYLSIENKYKKFSSLIEKKVIENDWEFPNPRINADLSEIHTGWNHVQIDQIGYFLYGIAKGESLGLKIIRNSEDIKIMQLCVDMLEAIDYHLVPESGAWEEGRECPRASTIGVIIAGLIECYHLKSIKIPPLLIQNGRNALDYILPNETLSRKYDLAQLFLIYPFNLLTEKQTLRIISNVEKNLLKDNGVIRYKNDKYFNNGFEAEWSFGLSYLGLIYFQLGDIKKSKYYCDKVLENGYNIPELYFGKTNIPNDNNPLSWSIAITIELVKKLENI